MEDPAITLTPFGSKSFKKKIATATNFVHPQELPPTSDAAKFYSMRTYYQVQIWLGSTSLLPQDWGWNLKDGQLLPIMCEKAPAPESILKMVKCACKGGCGSNRCSCRKNGLECSTACVNCKGVDCLNCKKPINDEQYPEYEKD